MVAADRGLKGRRPSFNRENTMSPETFALAVAVAVFAGGVIGLSCSASCQSPPQLAARAT